MVEAIKNKIAKLKSSLKIWPSATPLTQVENGGDAHVVFNPMPSVKASEAANFAYVFDSIRRNFKKYTTEAEYHLVPYNRQPEDEQKLIDRFFSQSDTLQRLAKYLDLALLDFETGALRFMQGAQNSDYKPDISIGGKNNENVYIGFKDAKGRQRGPFLSSHVVVSPLNQYDMLSVSIGYIDKHKKAILTHSFDYDVLQNADKYAEIRGDKVFMKNEEQLRHDKYAANKIRQTKERLKNKYER